MKQEKKEEDNVRQYFSGILLYSESCYNKVKKTVVIGASAQHQQTGKSTHCAKTSKLMKMTDLVCIYQ